MSYSPRFSPLLLALTLPLSSLLSAQPVPPAGIVERQIEEEYEAKQVEAAKEIPLLEIDLPKEQLDIGHEHVEIDSVIFSGNTLFTDEFLLEALQPHLGKELSMIEIQGLCLLLQEQYAKEGYFLARAYTPEQEIREGKLHITIIEGCLGSVSVIGNTFYSTSFIEGYFKRFEGKPIHYNRFLKTLFLLNENADLQAGAIFKKGEAFGTADVVIRVVDNRPLHLSFDYDNYGSDHTSKNRTGTKFDWGSALLYGDNVSVVFVVGSPIDSLTFLDVIYHVPVNTVGSSLDLSYLAADFKTDEVSMNPKGGHMRMKGISHIASAKFNQALHRTRRFNSDVFASFDYKQIRNFGSGIELSFDKLRVLTGGMNFDYIDGWQGRNLFFFTVGAGIPNILGGSSSKDKEVDRKGSGGEFYKGNLGIKRLQNLPWDCFLLLNGYGQLSFEKLPVPEQLYIGGVDTVRGYKLAEGLGDRGFVANAELRFPLPVIRGYKVPWAKKQRWGELLQLVWFVDHAQTWAMGADLVYNAVEEKKGKKKREATREPGRTILTSTGCGVRLQGPWKFQFSFDAGFPLTEKERSSTVITYFKVALNIL